MPEANDVELFEAVALKDAVVLVAFPTTGSAASIAAQYLVRNLSLPLVGHFRHPELAGFVNIQGGKVSSVVRIYGGEVVCKIGKNCPRLYVVTSDLALPPKTTLAIAERILSWAQPAHLLLVLEAVVRMEDDDTPDVFCGASDAGVLGELKKAGLVPMERALLGGLGAQVLLQAPLGKVKAATVLVEANRDHPDGRAAAALVEAIAKIVPEVQVDAKPLLKEAMELEDEIRQAQKQAEPPRNPPPSTYI